MHLALSDYVQHIESNKVVTIDFPLTKGLRHIVKIPPIFFNSLTPMVAYMRVFFKRASFELNNISNCGLATTVDEVEDNGG